jgi:hypothetical protein
LLFWGGRVLGADESWDAIYVSGNKTGYVHTFVEKVSDKGRDYLRVRIDMEQRLQRGNDVAVVNLMYGTIETPSGQVLRLDTRTTASNQEIRVHGDVVSGKMNLKLDMGGAGGSQELLIPWGPEVRGPYAPEQSMARAPLKPGEARSLKMFIPELNKVCTVELHARAVESVILGDGAARPLLRVDQLTFVDGKRASEYDARLWVDPSGQVKKSEQDVMGGIVMYRTTKEAAMEPGGAVQFDFIQNTVVKVPRKIPDAETTRHVKYRLTLKGADPADVFPTDSRQKFEPKPAVAAAEKADDATATRTGVLDVRSMGPLDGEPSASPADAQYLRSNPLINSDDTRVRDFSEIATRGAVDPWEKAVKINHWVFQRITKKNFENAFAPAGEVARTLSGDCTEHSVLSAAMCRAAGIPARVAIGLIYVESLGGFGYHMWTEVFINQRWVALDASFDQSTTDAVHLKLADTSLEGVSPFEAFLPVVKVVGKLEIEATELR